MAMIDLKQAHIFVQDGTPVTPKYLELVVGEGTFSFDEKRVIEYKLNRGLLYQTRLGNQEPMDVKLDFMWEFLRYDSGDPAVKSADPTATTYGATPTQTNALTFEEALKNINGASTWITTGADACAPYAVNLLIVWYPPCSGVKSEHYLLSEFRYEALNHDAKSGMVACSGKCNVMQPTITRV